MEKKKTKKAIAVKYSPTEAAPKIIAKGQGHVAEHILEKAEEVPVYEDAELVSELEKIELGDYIPPELYEAVAQILVFVTDLDKRSERWKTKD